MALKDVSGFNPLEVFLHPKKTVQAALDFPNIITAVILLVLPWIVGTIAVTVLNLQFDFKSNAARMALAVVIFFIQAGIIYALARNFGNKGKNLFEGVVSALSLTQIAAIILAIFAFVVLALNPQIISLANKWNAGELLSTDLVEQSFTALTANPISGIILLIAGLALVAYLGLQVLYLNFLAVHESTKTSAVGSIVLMVIVLVIAGILQNSLFYFLP